MEAQGMDLTAHWRKREKVPEPEVAPEVHNRKRKCPVGESRDAEVPDYRRVVLVLRPPLVDTSGLVPSSGDRVDEVVHSPPPLEESGNTRVPLPRSQGQSSDFLGRKRSPSPGSSWFIPPVVSERRSAVTINIPPPSQCSFDVPHPFPRARANAALKAENEALRAEVADLRKLLEASRTETSTLTSLLRDTTTSLDDRNKDLEASRRALQEVAEDCLEYGRVLAQFTAIEAELLQVPSEDALTRFHLAIAQADAYREVAIRQKQELSELCVQIDKEQKRSYEAHEELDAANARAICLRDRLEDLEETVDRYRTRAHVAEELIRKYPEDEGLYGVDLPSLSSLQNKLTASEVMLRHMATLAHRLHSADPANLLYHHNMYVGGLIEAVITLLSRSLLHPCKTWVKIGLRGGWRLGRYVRTLGEVHGGTWGGVKGQTEPGHDNPPEQMRAVVELALEYLYQGRLTHGKLHLRSTSSLLYYYSNAADHVDGLYQNMLTHPCFSSDEAFLTAAQHAGHIDARPGSLEPPLHCRLFSFNHPIPLPQSPTSNHIPAVPMMDAIMLMWEDMIGAYVREVLGYPASPGRILSLVEVPSSNDPLPATTSLVADDARSVLGANDPMSRSTPLFLPEPLSSTSPHSPSPISSSRVPDIAREVVDLTMDDAEDLYKSQEEFLARMGGVVTVKQEVTKSDSCGTVEVPAIRFGWELLRKHILVWFTTVSSPSVRAPIKGVGQVLLSSTMPPTPRPTLVPRTFNAHPYCAENQRLIAQIRLLESQLTNSQRENSSLTSALQDTSRALEYRQREVEQLRSSSREVLEREMEDRQVLDQFPALDEALLGVPGQSLSECFRKLQVDLRNITIERRVAVEELITSTRKNSQLTTTLLHQQGLVDESNALATRQRCLVEELQEEVHRVRGRAVFVKQMLKEYPDEGYYEVVLPPLSQLEGDLNKAREDLRRVATFAHHLYRCDPATVLHHHHRYIGAIIEAVVAFLHRGLDSDDPDIVVHNFQLALDYVQAARGVHGDMYMRSISSIQWFFNNAVDEDEGLYRMILEHSRFDNDSPFLMAAHHAGFISPPNDSVEPPLHRQMLALSTALPHSDGVGRWDNIVPAFPSIDQLTADWEQLMLQYIHHITDTPLTGTDTQGPMPSVEPATESLAEVLIERSPEALVALESTSSVGTHPQVPLFLPKQESLTSPSPTLPPLFGSITNLVIDLTGDDDELYETEEVSAGRFPLTN
ncbi:hypothetical protein F5051DRAFT_446397 [Lentinula edodes]|nr:hypothetical protein F5051DRAFT_446397 [Lentinula edodes]